MITSPRIDNDHTAMSRQMTILTISVLIMSKPSVRKRALPTASPIMPAHCIACPNKISFCRDRSKHNTTQQARSVVTVVRILRNIFFVWCYEGLDGSTATEVFQSS